jgi:hypothetical protein
MRPASVLLSAILLSCVPVHAYGGMPGDIAVPSMSVPNMDMPKPLVSGPNMDMPEPTPKPLVEPNGNLNPALNQTGNVTSNQTQAAQIQQTAEPVNVSPMDASPIDVSGKWSVKFDDVVGRSLDLSLWSSSGANRIMGFGTLMEGGRENSVTASGSVTEQELRLTAKLATPEDTNLEYDECNLDLFTVNDTLSGTYVLRSGGQFLGEGNATAVKQ